jgi:hypothetical protein
VLYLHPNATKSRIEVKKAGAKTLRDIAEALNARGVATSVKNTLVGAGK